MAIIKPFKAIRPAPDKVHLVASRSVDNYTKQELNIKLATNPYSFMHIIKPEHISENKSKANSTELLYKIKKAYTNFLDEEVFIADDAESIYVYNQVSIKGNFTGFLACAAATDYLNNNIKLHEQTLSEKEEKLKQYLEICDFNAEPVCFAHDYDADLETILNTTKINEFAIYDFTTADKVRHKVWKLTDKKIIQDIQAVFNKLKCIYIADGHHRSASSTRLAQWHKDKNESHTGNENYNYFLGIFFSETQLKIVEFNRLIKDLNGLSSEEFLSKLHLNFEVQKVHTNDRKSAQINSINLYLNKCWYSLQPKPNTFDSNHPVYSLDAQILSDNILANILNINDLRTDTRVSFVPGIKPIAELEKSVDSGKFAAAFVLHPVSMVQLKNVANSGQIMPPKSTWVEPKLRSGLIIFDLERS